MAKASLPRSLDRMRRSYTDVAQALNDLHAGGVT
jgi:hypothetical protein